MTRTSRTRMTRSRRISDLRDSAAGARPLQVQVPGRIREAQPAARSRATAAGVFQRTDSEARRFSFCSLLTLEACDAVDKARKLWPGHGPLRHWTTAQLVSESSALTVRETGWARRTPPARAADRAAPGRGSGVALLWPAAPPAAAIFRVVNLSRRLAPSPRESESRPSRQGPRSQFGSRGGRRPLGRNLSAGGGRVDLRSRLRQRVRVRRKDGPVLQVHWQLPTPRGTALT